MTLVERLLRKEPRFPAAGGGWIGTDANGKTTSGSYVTDDGLRLVNPDGPEAAAELEAMGAENLKLREALLEARAFVAIHGPAVAFPDLLANIDAALSPDSR